MSDSDCGRGWRIEDCTVEQLLKIRRLSVYFGEMDVFRDVDAELKARGISWWRRVWFG